MSDQRVSSEPTPTPPPPPGVQPHSPGDHADLAVFARRAGLAVLIAAFAYLLWYLRHTIILGFAAIVVATVISATASGLSRLLPLARRWRITIAIGLILGALGLTGRYGWPEFRSQSGTLTERVSAAIRGIESRFDIDLPDTLNDMPGFFDGGLFGRIVGDMTAMLQMAFSVTAGLLLVIVAGIYLAIDPAVYRRGFLLLFPPRQHDRIGSALDRAGKVLRLWLMGKLLAMTAVGAMVGVGAWAIGLPSPIALAFIAFATEFVPIVGPIVGAIPGLILALGVDPGTFLLAGLLYFAVQQIEANFVTPLVLGRVVEVPPAVLMVAFVAMGALFGALGVLLAGPLTVVAFVLVRTLYVEDTLGEKLDGKF